MDRALALLAWKITLEPWSVQAEDIDQLRRLGLDDAAIHHAVQVAAYFNYINRVCDALGVDLEPWMPSEPPEWKRSNPLRPGASR